MWRRITRPATFRDLTFTMLAEAAYAPPAFSISASGRQHGARALKFKIFH
jgi:hypothetical protein